MINFSELAQLFFETRQIIRAHIPGGVNDPNAWMRSETLRFIARGKQPGMKDIARYLRITAPSATSVVALLEREKLVVRRACTDDKRMVRIELTTKGRRAVAEYERDGAELMQRVFGKLSARELRDLSEAMRRVRSLHTVRQSGIMPGNERKRPAR